MLISIENDTLEYKYLLIGMSSKKKLLQWYT